MIMTNNKLTKRNVSNKNPDKFDALQKDKNPKTDHEIPEKPVPPKYGPMPRFPHQRVWTRLVLIFSILSVVWYTSRLKKETILASRNEILQHRGQSFECSDSFQKEISNFPRCMPKKCGRYTSDKLITTNEADSLLKMAKRGLSFGGSAGGASILDLHTGALSHGKSFINIYSLRTSTRIFHPLDVAIYRIVKTKIQHAIAQNFGMQVGSLHLTHPTFFSQLTNEEPRTLHDEYWHPHVDKDTYESFHYTSLLYLNDYEDDFTGGRLIFIDRKKNITLEPRKGRVAMFSSGEENLHFVERVQSGTRFAMTISFTCDPDKGILEPIYKERCE